MRKPVFGVSDQVSTHKIGLYEDLTKTIFKLSSNIMIQLLKAFRIKLQKFAAHAQTDALIKKTFIGLFQKKITFLVRKFQKICVWLLTLYAFIICQVIIRTQYYTNASLISAPVVILYQNVRGA